MSHLCNVRLSTSNNVRHGEGVTGDWRRLATYIRARRTKLGWYTAQAFADDTGLTRQTVSTVENGRSVRPSTLHRIEDALGWAPGSAEQVLVGGEPTAIEVEPPAAGTVTQHRRFDDPRRQELWERLQRPHNLTDEELAVVLSALDTYDQVRSHGGAESRRTG